MKTTKSALLVGVGGQGAILTAKVLVNGLMKAGYDVKMSEVHGMSQRGGSVSTQVHWGEKVYSPVIGKGAADIVVAFEKMEAVRYAEFLKPGGVAVINDYELPSSTVAAGLCQYPAGCLEAMEAHFRCVTLDAAAEAAVTMPDPGESPVLEAVMALPEKYRQAVYLRYYEEYGVGEIAALMGCRTTQVSTYLYRGKAKLRTMLGGIYGQECFSD